MTVIDFLTGWGAAPAGAAAFGMYVASVLRRERRGPQSRVTGLVTSQPVFTTVFVLVAAIALLLLVLRLGVMS